MLRALSLALLLLAETSVAQSETPPRLVKLVTVTEREAATTRQFFGQVAAKKTVDLAFQVGGQIVEVPIIEGEPVAQGETIATLDLEPFELALDQALVQLDLADRTLKRLERLQGGSVSQVTVDEAETQFKLAEIAVRTAERSLKDAQLLAPFDALVASRFVTNFSTIGAGTPVARLHDMSELRVEIDVPEVLFQRAGRDPDVELMARFPASAENFPLGVREFNAETSQVGQTFRITLGLAPPDDLAVFPGSSVTVFATLKGGTPTLAIPNAAVIAGNDGSTHVMVYEPTGAEEGTVRLVPVTITPDTDGAMTVTGGLEKGQEIVASGANLLSDGESVRRFTGFTN